MSRGRVMVHYSSEPATSSQPATLSFTINEGDIGLEKLRGLLPNTVRLEQKFIGYEMQGVNPAMTEPELYQVFIALTSERGWFTRHHG